MDARKEIFFCTPHQEKAQVIDKVETQESAATAIQALARRALVLVTSGISVCSASPSRWSCGSKRHWTGGAWGEGRDKEQQLEVLPTEVQ